jgi:hypothetical protein
MSTFFRGITETVPGLFREILFPTLRAAGMPATTGTPATEKKHNDSTKDAH